tara:strand:+ start:1079 stop:1357 length:279 start_codon:yes stop_codon:yes gene_type:complete
MPPAFSYNVLSNEKKEEIMSHPINDMIADDIMMTVDGMADKDVIMALSGANITKVAKFTGDKVHGANIVDFARTVLIDQLYDDAMSAPTPVG